MNWKFLDKCQSADGWSAVDDAANLTVNVDHRGRGVVSLEWDKSGGSDVNSGVRKTISAVDISSFITVGIMSFYIYISNIANVAQIVYSVGTDSTNYWTWATPDTDLASGWNHVKKPLSIPASQAGNGMNPSIVTCFELGVIFDAAGNTLNDIRLNDIEVIDRILTTT